MSTLGRSLCTFVLMAAAWSLGVEGAVPPDREAWARMSRVVPRAYVCYHAPEGVVIDGDLGDKAWQGVPWTEDFVDIEGAAKPAPLHRTRAKMAWDDRYFYIAAELEEPHVWAKLTRRDSVIFQDNDFEVFIDPDGDNHAYYEFEMNALNTVWDLFLNVPYKDGGKAKDDWDIEGLKTGVRVQGTLNASSDRDRGWTLEIAMPWESLRHGSKHRSPPREGDQWRVDFSRVEWQVTIENGEYVKVTNRPEDNWVWSPTGIVDMHRPERWGYVQFTREPWSKVGRVSFKSDGEAAARDWLCSVYYAQREHRVKHGRWAGSLKELAMVSPSWSAEGESGGVRLEGGGYLAEVKFKNPEGRLVRLTIQQDSKIGREEPR